MKYYAPSTNAIYASEIHDTMPSDSIKLPDGNWETYWMGQPPEGKECTFDSTLQRLVWIDKTIDLELIRTQAMEVVRKECEGKIEEGFEGWSLRRDDQLRIMVAKANGSGYAWRDNEFVQIEDTEGLFTQMQFQIEALSHSYSIKLKLIKEATTHEQIKHYLETD